MKEFIVPPEYILTRPSSLYKEAIYTIPNTEFSIHISYSFKNVISNIEYYKGAKLHREDGAAIIIYNTDTGLPRSETYYLHGVKQLVKEYYDESPYLVRIEHYYTKTPKFNPDGLILRSYYESGELHTEKFGNTANNTCHKDNNPAVVEYYKNGLTKKEEWYKNGLLHRENKPATLWYNEIGNITSEYWYYEGKHHCETGPATCIYEYNFYEWYYHGETLTKSIIKNKYPHIYPYFITFYQKELPEEYEAYLKKQSLDVFI